MKWTVVTGVLAAIVLLTGLTASVFYVRDRGEQARRDEAIRIAEAQLREEADRDIAISPVPQSAPDPQASPPTRPTLPQTGLTNPIYGIVVTAIVAFALTSYIRSRSTLARL